jgi:hypothetical protein
VPPVTLPETPVTPPATVPETPVSPVAPLTSPVEVLTQAADAVG